MKKAKLGSPEKGNEYLKQVRYAQAALAMVGLRFDLETSLLIKNTMAAYLQKGVHFTVNDAINVRYNTAEFIELGKLNEQEHETSK